MDLETGQNTATKTTFFDLNDGFGSVDYIGDICMIAELMTMREELWFRDGTRILVWPAGLMTALILSD